MVALISFAISAHNLNFTFCIAELDRERKKRRGLALKRSKPPAREAKTYIQGKLRKKSAFSVFKSEFLSKEGKWSSCFLRFHVGFWAERAGKLTSLQCRRGRHDRGTKERQHCILDDKEHEIYQKRADDANSNSGQVRDSAVSGTKLVQKIVSNKCKYTVT